jgi:cystathionine gamma-synthase
MRDPFTDPFCKKEDLGRAIPESDHAVSVCLPRWKDVIGYEEGDPEVIDTFECGYPRFVPHPFVAELFLAAQEEFGKKQETALVFPSLAAAWRCAEYVKRRTGASSRLETYGWENLTVVLLEEESYGAAWKYWQHSGEIVSSRLAESALTDSPVDEEVAARGRDSTRIIKERIASFYEGIEAGDVFLLSSGMGAVSAVHRILTEESDDPTIQIEFPYLDSFKVQEQFGGVVDFSITSTGGVEETRDWLEKGRAASAVFSEIPSNPLLRTPDLAGLSQLLGPQGIPLVVDDTVATSVNVDPFRYADVVTTSLTKTFSGAGDVAAGAIIVKPGTRFSGLLHERLPDQEAAAPLFSRDAIALEGNSRHYEERARATNEIAEEVVNAVRERPEVSRCYFPETESRSFYDQVKKEDGGYGALFSIELSGGEAAAAAFYDHLRISKGPSLGTDFSLACPYTLLAHYGELDWAAERGAKRDLLRIWIGLEEPEDLIGRIEEAMDSIE